jgi:dihydropteroate synthase
MFRVHDVAATRDALAVVGATVDGGGDKAPNGGD